ncbi:hypothetical protein BCY86_06430 [Pajaroellobacter abortibovis]|uniref:Uncharacterized protein n=1 Tax=Pajaroellobacter abortibovis TaxID=1882918 RepID=A0A1L6MXU5_9BACT|nr:hypothetical protein BCY86_06430 [Pajaroellobacter abortibovis]
MFDSLNTEQIKTAQDCTTHRYKLPQHLLSVFAFAFLTSTLQKAMSTKGCTAKSPLLFSRSLVPKAPKAFSPQHITL